MKARRVKRISAKSIREKNIAVFAKKTAKYAIKKAVKKNVTVTMAKAGKIYRVHPDGKKELVRRLPRKVKVKYSVIKIAD